MEWVCGSKSSASGSWRLPSSRGTTCECWLSILIRYIFFFVESAKSKNSLKWPAMVYDEYQLSSPNIIAKIGFLFHHLQRPYLVKILHLWCRVICNSNFLALDDTESVKMSVFLTGCLEFYVERCKPRIYLAEALLYLTLNISFISCSYQRFFLFLTYKFSRRASNSFHLDMHIDARLEWANKDGCNLHCSCYNLISLQFYKNKIMSRET